MKAKYWLAGGASSIGLAYIFDRSYQSFLSNNLSLDSFDFSAAQNYESWILIFASIGWTALIIGAVLIVLQKSPRRWHRWYRLAAAGFLLSVAWSIVGISVQTFTGDVLFWLGYQKPANPNYAQLEQLFQANNWKEADEATSSMIRQASGTPIHRNPDPTFATFSRLPCADFQAIDRVWLKHSGDRFGFSVQRRIYENTKVPEGHPSEYSLFDDKTEIFLKQVKRSGNENPTFSREDAIGSLPSIGIWLATPVSSIQQFSTEESVKRQKWCGF